MRFSLISCCNTAATLTGRSAAPVSSICWGSIESALWKRRPSPHLFRFESLFLILVTLHLSPMPATSLTASSCGLALQSCQRPALVVLPESLYLGDAIEAFCASRSFCAILCFQHLDIYCRHTPLHACSFLFVRINPIAHVK